MGIEVSIHPSTRVELFDDVLRDYPEIESCLLADFKRYIETQGDVIPNYFGCDQPYSEPSAARSGQLRHIHIALPPQVFNENVAQCYRKCSKEKPELDAALVYVQGEYYEDRYMILAFFAPRAHDKAKVNAVMTRLGLLAKEFRDQN